MPALCVLDPDGDIVRHLCATGRAKPDPDWPCYHSILHRFEESGRAIGIVGCAVGAPFAVPVAEQMFASGCELLISITSSGQITALRALPYFILIEAALRDEGTSYHYLPPGAFVDAPRALVAAVAPALTGTGEPVERGATWTTDAPYRETEQAIPAARARGILAVEMGGGPLRVRAGAARPSCALPP